MRSLLLLWMLWLSTDPSEQNFCIKGKVVLKGEQEGMPGVEVTSPGAKSPTLTDMNGYFYYKINRKKSYALQLEFPTMASVQLLNIEANGRDTMDIGKIEMIPNRVISRDEWEALDQSIKQKTVPLHCYGTLLGYVLLNEVESKDLNSGCKDKKGQPYYYSYDSSINTIKIDYKRVKECR